MTLDEVLKKLFPERHQVTAHGDLVTGSGPLASGGDIAVIGIANGAPLLPEHVVYLGDAVLKVVEAGKSDPILVLVDTQGQVMSRHAEMIGLNEYCAHLAKCLLLASQQDHRTIGLVYGKAAAGAFLATALAADVLIAIDGAEPAVMDLPSIARVTKLPEDKLAKMAKTTPVFAPGVGPLFKTGAVTSSWSADQPFPDLLVAAVKEAQPNDVRDVLGKQRGGRLMAADVAARVVEAAIARP